MPHFFLSGYDAQTEVAQLWDQLRSRDAQILMLQVRSSLWNTFLCERCAGREPPRCGRNALREASLCHAILSTHGPLLCLRCKWFCVHMQQTRVIESIATPDTAAFYLCPAEEAYLRTCGTAKCCTPLKFTHVNH